MDSTIEEIGYYAECLVGLTIPPRSSLYKTGDLQVIEEPVRLVIHDEGFREMSLFQQRKDVLVVGNVVIDVGIAGKNDGNLIILAEPQEFQVVGSRMHFMSCRHQTAGIDFQQSVILLGSEHDGLEKEFGRAIARMGDDMGPRIADGGNHALGVLFRRATLPAEFMDACDAEIQTMLVVVFVEVERTLGVKNVQLGSQQKTQAVDHARNDMEIAEMDGMAGAWNAGSMLCDSQDLQPFLFGGGDHLL